MDEFEFDVVSDAEVGAEEFEFDPAEDFEFDAVDDGRATDTARRAELGRQASEDEGRVAGLKNLAMGFGAGSNQLYKIALQGYGLVTGEMNEEALQGADRAIAFYNDKKTKGQLAKEELLGMDVAREKGLLNKAYRSFVGTLSEPALIGKFVSEQLPMLVATGGAGNTARLGAKALGAGLKTAGKLGTAGAVGTGAALQGSSVGGETFERLLEQNPGLWALSEQYSDLVASGMGEDQAKAEIAMDLSRNTALKSGAISVLVNAFGPARALEQVLSGGAKSGRGFTGNFLTRGAKGAGAEGLSEAIEEGSGQFISNAEVQEINPEQSLSEGVGEAAGQGALSSLFGGPAGMASKRRAKPTATTDNVPEGAIDFDEFHSDQDEAGDNQAEPDNTEKVDSDKGRPADVEEFEFDVETPDEAEARVKAKAEQDESKATEQADTKDIEGQVYHSNMADELETLAAQAANPAVRADLERQAKQIRATVAGKKPKLSPKERQRQKLRIDPTKDDLITAVRKLDGVNIEVETDFAGRLSHLHKSKDGLPNIEQKGTRGRSLDDLTIQLQQYGYLQGNDQSVLAELLRQAESGEPVYSTAFDMEELAKQQQRDFYQEQRDRMRAKPLSEIIEDLSARGIEPTVIEQYLNDFESEGLNSEQVYDEFQSLLADMPEPETPTTTTGNDNGQRQDTDAELSTREGQNANQRQPQNDTTDGPGNRQQREAGVSQQDRSESNRHQQEDNAEHQNRNGNSSESRVPDQNRSRQEAQKPETLSSGRQQDLIDDGQPGADALPAAPKKPETVTQAAKQADPDPTPAQAQAGNYKKGHTKLFGRDVSIETKKGGIRKGPLGDDGKPTWQNKMGGHYGHILGTKGADGDPIDVFIGNFGDKPNKPTFVMNQKKTDGTGFDEHKVFVGYESQAQARKAYTDSYPKGWKATGDLIPVTPDELKTWLNSGDTKTEFKPVSESIPKNPADKTPANINATELQDFGEKIGGARKDVYGAYGQSFDADVDTDSAKLSDVFPLPDYKKLAADGVPMRTLATLAMLRKVLGNRPRSRYKVSQWVKAAEATRESVRVIMSGDVSAQRIDGMTAGVFNEGQLGMVDIMEQIPPGQLTEAAKFGFNSWSKLDLKTDERSKVFALTKSKKGLHGYQTIVEHQDMETAKKQAAAYFAQLDSTDKPKKTKGARKPIPLGIYTDRKSGKSFIGFKRVGRHIRIKDGFDSVKEARAYLAENIDELNAEVEQRRQPPALRRVANSERVGPQRRDTDVTQDMFGLFNFYGVEFGNWVELNKRQLHLNEAYDAFIDLAEAINVPPEALSLGNTLGIAFGARGRGGQGLVAAAHFEPDKIAINLTKKAGAGSLAHEWLHALDNHFARANKGIEGRKPSTGYLTELASGNVDQVRPELYAAWQDVVKQFKGTKLLETSKDVDATFVGKKYFQTNIELMARSFETYVTEKLAASGISNDYLANIDKSGGVYPAGSEYDAIAEKFDAFFNQLKQVPTEAGLLLREDETSYEVMARRNSYRKNPDQVELDLYIPTNEEAHANPAQAAAESIRSLRGPQSTLLANRLAKDFRDQSSVRLHGQYASTPEDLAVLGQVYRNPSFETARFFVTDKNNRIVWQTGYSSRLPGEVSFRNDGMAKLMEQLNDVLDASDGGKLYMLHNHPSGNPTPSDADRKFTGAMIKSVGAERFGSHVVVNNDQYAVIDNDYNYELHSLPDSVKPQYIAGNNPTIPNPVLGSKVLKPADFAAAAKQFQSLPGYQLMSRSKEYLQGIADIDPAWLDQSEKRMMAALRDFVRKTGSQEVALVNVDEKALTDKQTKMLKTAIGDGALLDVITDKGVSWRETLPKYEFPTTSHTGALDARQASSEIREDKVPYGDNRTVYERFKTQPFDTAIRAPFQLASHLAGGNVSRRTKDTVSKASSTVAQSISTRVPWSQPIIEHAQKGFIENHGLDQSYVRLGNTMAGKKQTLLMETQDLIEEMDKVGINDVRSAKAFHAMQTGEGGPSNAQWKALDTKIRNRITDLGKRAVDLNLVSQESFDRNKAIYLHRVYQKYEVNNQTGLSKFVDTRRKRIIGDGFRGRGIFKKIAASTLPKDAAVGNKFHVYDIYDPETDRFKKRVIEPEGTDTSGDADGEVRVMGIMELRNRSGKKATLWRDFSKPEREKMGEIMDARYAVARTLQLLSHDIATGEFFRDIAKNPEWTWTGDDTPPNPIEANQLKLGAYTPIVGHEWVKVPDTNLPGTGSSNIKKWVTNSDGKPEQTVVKGKKKWGALAGKYVRAEIYQDLMQVESAQSSNTWRKILAFWKVTKTARNPVVHLNNVISNLFFMDMADVTAVHLVRAVREFRSDGAIFREARENGMLGSDYVTNELRKDTLDPVLDEWTKESRGGRGAIEAGLPGRFKYVSKTLDAVWSGAKKADKAMIDAYQAEDNVFRLALYIKLRESGMSAQDAGVEARDGFLNYDIRAPYINAMRRSAFPFIGYTYRAIPRIAQMIAERPWKLAKYLLISHGLTALAYSLAGGDEEEERRSMREVDQGYTILGVHKLVRLPTNDPTFVDIKRFIPGGDMFDLSQGQNALGFLPAPLQPGGPLMMAFEFLLNKQAFTGNEITNELTDDLPTKMKKTLDWQWKSWMPSAPWVPNSWYWEKIDRALKGARDYRGERYSLSEALLSSFGVKIRPVDIDFNLKMRGLEFTREEQALTLMMRQVSGDYNRGLIDEAQYQRELNYFKKQMANLTKRAKKVFDPE